MDTQKKCVNCGGGIHGSGSYAERLQSCPAQGKTYGRCLKKNHFSPVCRSKDAGQGPVSQNQILSGVSNSLQAAAETGGMDNGAHGAITSGAGNGIWEEWQDASFNDNNLTFFSLQQQVMPAISTLSQLAAMTKLIRSNGVSISTIPLPHSIHSAYRGWTKSRPKSSPTHPVQLRVHKASYKDLNLSLPRSDLRNVPSKCVDYNPVFDTGAQMNITSISMIKKIGYNAASLFPVTMTVESASKEAIYIIGGIILEVIAINKSNNLKVSTLQLFYVSDKVRQTYLSRDCCEQLQILPSNFPTTGGCPPTGKIASISENKGAESSSTCSNSGVPTQADQPCNCPKRSLPPDEPPTLPCEPTEANLPVINSTSWTGSHPRPSTCVKGRNSLLLRTVSHSDCL